MDEEKSQGSSLEEIAREINPKIRGWIQYYGVYNKSAMYSVFQQLDYALMKWAMKKYKKFRKSRKKAADWISGFRKREPTVLAHWQLGFQMVYRF